MIHFYDKSREIVMKLSDFSFDNEQEQSIRFSSTISYAFYKASQNIESYRFDLEDLLKELNLLHANKINSVLFRPIEGQLEICFKQLEFGCIAVSLKLNYVDVDNYTHNMYESMLMINYEIDQSFIPELINEIEMVLKR
ncbi:hypothetical protein D0T50_12345 [Bacteroides sp. 214]|uniref:WapI family immunity protein n=1 Tax=Bacteroides sp. 214 TaxID=2302935 RepID=UPI0013D46BA8|nr:hypothetical protein [Bacteroides sp. 214]NDW13674.1 hypothetical protein [Bacteroides sp. 214]